MTSQSTSDLHPVTAARAESPVSRLLQSPAAVRIQAWARHDAFWLGLLVLAALIYFGSYVRYGINFRDEGGDVALIAKRLLDGERPFLDVDPGYNVMWFYPIVGLFKLFGVSFVLLRAYCFFLSTCTALLGFLTVQRVTGRRGLAFAAGLLLVIAPGMTFKNYMPLLVMGNMYCLVHFSLAGIRRENAADDGAKPALDFPWRHLYIGAAALGFTYLVRVDLGIFNTVLWLAAITGRAYVSGAARWWSSALPAVGALAGIVCVLHAPVWLDAYRRGFDRQFVAQYVAWPVSIEQKLLSKFGQHPAPAHPRASAPPASAALDPAAKDAVAAARTAPINRETLSRSWRDFFHAKDGAERVLIVLLYLPLLFGAPLVGWAIFLLWQGFRQGDRARLAEAIAALLALGAAFTDFPQYFFFRPDAPHLSEFSPGYWVAILSAGFLLSGSLRPIRGQGSGSRWLYLLLLAVLAGHIGLYLWRTFPDRWTGTIAARRGRTHLFHGANGVNVYLNKGEHEGLTALVKVIGEHSTPADYLVAYPYHPAVNLVADRRTYEKHLYVDNATTAKTSGGKDWEVEAIGRLQRFQPAVVVLSDWPINETDASRFSVWAARVKAWIQAHYDFQGAYMGRESFEVYTRKP